MLDRIRNMWEFANLAQWIFIFGKAVKIDENIDVEVSIHHQPVITSGGRTLTNFWPRNRSSKWNV